MEVTLQHKIGFINTVVKRCDRLKSEHGDSDGCLAPNCNEIIKAIERDLRDMDIIKNNKGN